MNRPTMSAIETAVRNGEKMLEANNYSCDPIPGMPGKFYVQHNEQSERCYIVDTRFGKERCTCEQFARVGICKHEWYTHELRRIADAEEMLEAQGR